MEVLNRSDVSIAPSIMARAALAHDARPLPDVRAVGTPPQRWRESLALIERYLPFSRRTVRAGDAIQRVGDPFNCLHILNLGTVKTVNLAADGREQIVSLNFKGDWVGLDCMASPRWVCDVIAMDTSEVWSIDYATLLQSVPRVPALLQAVHGAMSCQLSRDREWRLAQGTLSADARVADFLRSWAASLAERDLRTDQITLRMTRAEIGNYLGMTIETVSRAFSRLARSGLISFEDKGRRNIAIPRVESLLEFVQRTVRTPSPALLQ